MSTFNQTNVTNFVLDIPDTGLTKAFKLNVQSALIPGIRTPVATVSAGQYGIARANLPGSTVEFDPLPIKFLVDENLDSWLEMYKWMLTVNNYLTLEHSTKSSGKIPEFITLHILDNSKQNIVISIHYYGAWCSELGEIEYNYTEETDIAMTCTATFNYKYFQVEKDGIIITDRLSIDENFVKNGGSMDALIGVNPRLR